MDAVTWRDNPILTRHLRSRLRPHELWPACLVVACLCTFMSYSMAIGTMHTMSDRQAAYIGFVVVQGILLFVMGTAQVFSSVFRSKEADILDFHRISPLSSLTLVLGFLFGAPIREYLLFAITVPFSFVAVAVGALTSAAWLTGLFAMVLAAVMYHLAALIAGLVAERGKAGYGAAAAVVLLLHALGALAPFSYLTIVPAVQLMFKFDAAMVALPSLTPEVLHFALALLHQGLLIVFLLLGATRKMRHEDTPLWSKPAGLVFFFLIARLAALDLSSAKSDDVSIAIAVVYTLWITALWLCLMATPSIRDHGRGLRRALREGLKRAPAWADAATNQAPLLAMAGLLGISLAILPGGGYGDGAVLPKSAALPAVLSLLAFGWALQAFTLQYRKKAKAFFLFLLFMLWVVPLLVAAMAGWMHDGTELAGTIYCLTPLSGLALSSCASTSMVALMAGTAANAALAAYFGWRCWRSEQAAATGAQATP